MRNKDDKTVKLVTFQSFEAVKSLFEKGYLECDDKKIDFKNSSIYDWIVLKMNEKIVNNSFAKYPLWCWVKCYNGICPPKRKGEKISGFDVKITFNKRIDEVFITDYIRYSFLLNNQYIPDSLEDKNKFIDELKKYNITFDELRDYIRKKENIRDDKDFLLICNKIMKSFDKCITTDSNILQGNVYRININEIENIEVLPDGYTFGSLNYIRANGQRIDWIKEYYKKLK